MSSYEINSAEQNYGLTFEDNISLLFATPNTCGPLVFGDIQDKNSILDVPIGDLVTVVGTDSVAGIGFKIFAGDYSIISEDEDVTLTFNFNNAKAAAQFSQDFYIELIWVDICTLTGYESYLSLDSLSDITHSVIT